MSYKVCMIGNSSELWAHITIVRTPGGGAFRLFAHLLLFVWEKLGWNDDPSLSKQQKKPRPKDWRDLVWGAFGRSRSRAGDRWKSRFNLTGLVAGSSFLICGAFLHFKKAFFFLSFSNTFHPFPRSFFPSFQPFCGVPRNKASIHGFRRAMTRGSASAPWGSGLDPGHILGDVRGEQFRVQTPGLPADAFLKVIARAKAFGGAPGLFHSLTSPSQSPLSTHP